MSIAVAVLLRQELGGSGEPQVGGKSYKGFREAGEGFLKKSIIAKGSNLARASTLQGSREETEAAACA